MKISELLKILSEAYAGMALELLLAQVELGVQFGGRNFVLAVAAVLLGSLAIVVGLIGLATYLLGLGQHKLRIEFGVVGVLFSLSSAVCLFLARPFPWIAAIFPIVGLGCSLLTVCLGLRRID